MAKVFSLCVLSIVITTLNTISIDALIDDEKVYIVYMGALPKSEYSPIAHHQSILSEVLEDSLPADNLIRSYGKSFNGFAAKLTEREREKLAENVKRIPTTESDMVIGLIDSGVQPESESFNDERFGPPPKKWKGACNGGKKFKCNNKLIGARYYSSHSNHDSAVDDIGHGTHTASIAAGNKVNDESFYGLAQGTARGGVPSARIATYRVCWKDKGCQDPDILAAFDDAISDGVDVISISIGGYVEDYSKDVIAIGAFHAMQKGILASVSAGNSGPDLGTLDNVAPWTLSVAASTIDRRIINKVTLGNGTIVEGIAVNAFDMKRKMFPLIYNEGHVIGKVDCHNCYKE